ncbi:MAG: hypothetical protein MI746_05495 [Pseudomonadales bacterium]|nr:hypothetical protein [Pseudomonadales bacterium]
MFHFTVPSGFLSCWIDADDAHSATGKRQDKAVTLFARTTVLHYHDLMLKITTNLLALVTCLLAANALSQEARDTLEGSWEGPLVLGRDNMNLAFTFIMSEGDYSATLTSGGMGIYGMPVTSTSIEGRNIIIRIPRLDLEFTGTIRRDDDERITRIDGDWFQYSEMVPVVLRPVAAPTF